MEEVSNKLFNYISNYEIVNTNRLHIGIAGCLIGKKVNFYKNSYYKNKASYEFSIKNKFKNIFFEPKVTKITIKGSSDKMMNGLYYIKSLSKADKDTYLYYKDDNYQL